MEKSVDNRSKLFATKTLFHDCLKVISEVLNAITCNQKQNFQACKDIHPKSLYRLKLKKKVNREEDGSKDNSNQSA